MSDEVILPVSVQNIKDRIEEIHRKKAEKEKEKDQNKEDIEVNDKPRKNTSSDDSSASGIFSKINKRKKNDKSSSANENFADDDFGYPKEKTTLTSSKKLSKISETSKEKEKEVKENKEWKNTKSKNSKNNSIHQIDSHSVNLITESIKTASYIINNSSDNIDIGNNFSKFLKRQKQLSEITQSKLNLNFSAESQKGIEVEINSSISDILVDIHNMKDSDVMDRFSMLCEQVMAHRDYWRGNEKAAPLLPIRAKAATFDAALECWLAIEDYPFSHNIDKDIIKMFLMVITLARDIAQNWDEELDGLERQQLYVNIIGPIAKTARKKWEISCLNNLSNSCDTLDDIKDYHKEKIKELFPIKVFGSQVGKDISESITGNLVKSIELYEEGFDHLPNKISTRLKKTILRNMNSSSIKVVSQYIDENGLDSINKKIEINGIEVLFDDIMEQIEVEIESSPPYVITDFDKYNQELKDGIAQMWGASQGIYKFRS